MRQIVKQLPHAQVTLRAYQPAPARIELSYQPLPGRLARTLGALLLFWGAIPFLIWVPPHYPWVTGAFVTGLYLAYRSWTGRYRVYAFAGVCPRCGHAVSLGIDHAISLPHTLTCYSCHFEPRLEVRFGEEEMPDRALAHATPECTGKWEMRWLADEAYLICNRCFVGAPAARSTLERADEENESATLLEQLTREGRTMI